MIGSVLSGRYELVEQASTDAVFSSYRAQDRKSGTDVFVRVLRDELGANLGLVNSMQNVVGGIRDINHPSLERFLASESDGRHNYLVSEYTAGTTLAERLKRLASLSVPVAVALAIDVCEGLVPLHASGVVHGDISAKNVLALPSEGLKLLKPGFWQVYGQEASCAVWAVKEMSPYLAPEVTAGGMPTQMSDVYAVGVLIWLMLAGRLPYVGDNPVAIATHHATREYPSLRSVSASVPVALDELVKKCMDKNPLRRYGSVSALLGDLRTIQDALRFGRKLTWPLTGAQEDYADEPVAPSMNVANPSVSKQGQMEGTKSKRARKAERKREPDSDGVPVWFAAIVYVMTILVIVVLGGWFFFNSSKPKTVDVPNIVGKQVDEARSELKKLGLDIRQVRSEVSDKVADGAIIDQDPAMGEQSRVGMRVEVTVSKGSRFKEVPDLRGRSVEEARQVIQDMGLVLDEDNTELVRDKDLDEGLIVSHVPESGKKVERGTKIRLKVSNGDKRVRTTRSSSGATHTNRITFDIPPMDATVIVRIDVTDDNGTRTLFEEKMEAGQTVDERVRWVGNELIVRTFFDGELVDQKSVTPEESED